MTVPVIQTLDEHTVHLFDTLPDPLRVREAHRLTRHRPDWKRVALRDGTVVARAAWWGGPDDSEPLMLDWFDVAEGEEAAGAELLRSAPWQVDDLMFMMPAGWRDVPEMKAAATTRFAAARTAGYRHLVDRFAYLWTPRCGLPERPGRLVFAPEPDDAVFFDALRRIHSVTLDAHARRAVDKGGVDLAVQEEMDFFRWCPSPREWWQVARTRQGEPVGIHIPAHNPERPCIGFVGVLPQQRGHGYGYDLLAECTHFLVEQGAESIAAATDQGNSPMAAHFSRAGYPIQRERVHFQLGASAVVRGE
jgi:GNAT superfamily N-acetyltransferase